VRRSAIPLAFLTLAWAGRALAAASTAGECVSASNASAELRVDHKLRKAREQLLTCVAASCPVVVRDECMKRMDQVVAEIPTVVFHATDGEGHELSAVKVTMDDEVLNDHLDGSAMALDPGEHRFTFETAGRPPLTKTILVHEGDKDRAEAVVLAPAPSAPAAPARADDGAPPRSASTMRTIGFAVGGVGIAGLVVGGIFGGLALDAWGQASSECPGRVGCSAQALGNRSNAVTFSTVSDVGFIAGGALAALGVTLVVLAPRSSAPVVGAQIAPGCRGVVGRF
jgi:hypothetical protein